MNKQAFTIIITVIITSLILIVSGYLIFKYLISRESFEFKLSNQFDNPVEVYIGTNEGRNGAFEDVSGDSPILEVGAFEKETLPVNFSDSLVFIIPHPDSLQPGALFHFEKSVLSDLHSVKIGKDYMEYKFVLDFAVQIKFSNHVLGHVCNPWDKACN